MGVEWKDRIDIGGIMHDRETGIAVVVSREVMRGPHADRAKEMAERQCAAEAAKVREQAKGVAGVSEAERARAVSFLMKMSGDHPGDLGQVFKVAADLLTKGAHLK